MAVAIPIIISAVVGGVNGAVAGGVVGAIVGIIVGAAVGAISLALQPDQAGTGRKTSDVIHTTSVRNLPVPIVFGRARMAGNWIALGSFFTEKDRKGDTPGRRIRILNAFLGICEGWAQAMGGIYQDGRLLASALEDEEFGTEDVTFDLLPGTPIASVPDSLNDAEIDYGIEIPVPWRNTAVMEVQTVVGETARLPEVAFDLVGPNLTLHYSDSEAGTNPEDDPSYGFYDAHTEAFYYVANSSTATAGNRGLFNMGRRDLDREHTAPPDGIGTSVTRAFYLGRHDVLVMQDPGSPAVWWVGYWGIAPDSADWERHTPHAGYASPMSAAGFHLDELHGILHTLHEGPTKLFVLRWSLLTGRVEKTEINVLKTVYATAFQYAPDMDAYVLGADGDLLFINPRTGDVFHQTAALDTTYARGYAVSGQRVGVIDPEGLVYYDPFDSSTSDRLGSDLGGSAEGHFGQLIWACQNTWTGQVCLVKKVSDTTLCINFQPSINEDSQDCYANGTPGGEEFWSGGTIAAKFTRDWSYRTYNAYDMKALEGNSSLAGAMWAMLVDEPGLDSGRYGAGLDRRYFSLPSFEAVHGYCVGQVKGADPGGLDRYAERCKLDIAIDSVVNAAEVMSSEMLTACNGYRVVVGGVLHVGVHRSGMFPAWHFTDDQLGDSSVKVNFLGRGGGVNQVRVQYRNARDNYRLDWAEANDEWDQNARGRVQSEQVTSGGVARFVHANWLAKQVLDLITLSRRQVEFDTHFVGWVLVPGDPIEVTHAATGLQRARFRVAELRENEDGVIKLVGQEHRPINDILRGGADAPNTPGGTDTDGEYDCYPIQTNLDGTTRWAAGGAVFSAGPYQVNYLGGAWAVAASDGGTPEDPSDDTPATYYVRGFDIVTRTAAAGITEIGPAPGLVDGYATYRAATRANRAESVVIDLNEAGPIGIRFGGSDLGTGVEIIDIDGATTPIFEVCTLWNGSGGTDTTYVQAKDCETGEAVDVWVRKAVVPARPYYFLRLSDNLYYKIESDSTESETPGTLAGSIQAVDGCPEWCGPVFPPQCPTTVTVTLSGILSPFDNYNGTHTLTRRPPEQGGNNAHYYVKDYYANGLGGITLQCNSFVTGWAVTLFDGLMQGFQNYGVEIQSTCVYRGNYPIVEHGAVGGSCSVSY